MNATQTTKVGKAFYYPYIEIQDINWLKQALLYWDGLRRMLPPHYVTWWTEVSRKTKDANKSPWHYLLSIKELTPPPEATPIYMYPLF